MSDEHDGQSIRFLTPIHKACADEPDLYDSHAVRVLPVPEEFGKALACAMNGSIIAVADAEAEDVALIPAKAMPSSLKGVFEIQIKGKVDDIVVGRTTDGPRKGVLAFEAIGDAKLRSGVETITACSEAARVGDGVLIQIDPESLVQLSKAIANVGAKAGPVHIYAQPGKAVLVIGSGGIGLVKNTDEGDSGALEKFHRMASDLASAFKRIPKPPEPKSIAERVMDHAQEGTFDKLLTKGLGEGGSVTISSGGRSHTAKAGRGRKPAKARGGRTAKVAKKGAKS